MFFKQNTCINPVKVSQILLQAMRLVRMVLIHGFRGSKWMRVTDYKRLDWDNADNVLCLSAQFQTIEYGTIKEFYLKSEFWRNKQSWHENIGFCLFRIFHDTCVMFFICVAQQFFFFNFSLKERKQVKKRLKQTHVVSMTLYVESHVFNNPDMCEVVLFRKCFRRL